MKYYAVTEDPNELMHFGIKGMKWGIIRTPEQLGHHKAPKKPRSPAYMKASAKLSKAMRQGIAKAQANWDAYNSPENKQIRAEKRAINKEIHAYNRAEKKFQKHLQQARQGRLKYKGISDDEVNRITDRLALERQSRLLSGTEKQSFGRRLRSSVAEGIVEGVGRGTSSYIDARMRGRGQTTANIKSEQRMAKYHNSLKGRLTANRESRAENRKAYREAKRNADAAYYKMAAENGELRSKGSALFQDARSRLSEASDVSGVMRRVAYGNMTKEEGNKAIDEIRTRRRMDRAENARRLTKSGRAEYVSMMNSRNEEEARRKAMLDAATKTYASAVAKNRADAEQWAHNWSVYGSGDGKAHQLGGTGASSPVVRTPNQTPGNNVHQVGTDLIPYARVSRKDSHYSTRSRKNRKNRPIKGEGTVY